MSLLDFSHLQNVVCTLTVIFPGLTEYSDRHPPDITERAVSSPSIISASVSELSCDRSLYLLGEITSISFKTMQKQRNPHTCTRHLYVYKSIAGMISWSRWI